MRGLCVAALIGTLLASSMLALPAAGQQPDGAMSRPMDREELDAARFQLRLFERIEYPVQLREMGSDIKLQQIRLRMLKDRLRDYQRFPRSPFVVTLQNTQLQLLQAEQDLRRTRHQRMMMQIHAREKVRRQKRMLERAESRLEKDERREESDKD